MKIAIYFKNKRIFLNVKKLSFIGKVFGLTFKRKSTKNLLFEFSDDKLIAIHSIFVFFPFLAIWLDSHNRVLEIRYVKPFTFHILPKKKFRKLIELPLNDENKDFSFFRRKRKDLNI